jgi:signal transduction histidine kinase/DNA-binding CsgD family transcriptional regulator
MMKEHLSPAGLAAREMAIREDERRRLARVLEERLGQRLGLLVAQVGAYQSALSSPARVGQAMRTLSAVGADALDGLHDLVSDLSPSDLADLGLGPALETLALRVERRYGLDVTLDLSPGVADSPAGYVLAVPSYPSLAAYRIAQQALQNAGQHAGAGRVGISLRLEAESLRLTVADDGNGFHPPDPLEALSAEGKRGLAEMVVWAEAAGGWVEISSVPGVGTQVRVELPLVVPERPEQRRASDGVNDLLIEPLTPREREVLAGVTAGLTNKQIAAQLGISDRTVQFHLGNVLGKLGVASRTEAAVLALQRDLV